MSAVQKPDPILELPPGRPPLRTPIGAVLLDRPATLRDLDRLPRTWRGEIIRDTIYAFPRPRSPHQRAETRIVGDIEGPFDRGRGGPGGWIILEEPGIELPAAAEFSPDIAGWRRDRLPKLPRHAAITIVPDWICEVLSRRTRSYDQIIKRRFYAEIGVQYLWYIDPLDKTLAASKLDAGRWLEIGVWGNDQKVRMEPFEAVELDLAAWWGDVEESHDEEDEEASPPPPSTESST